MTIRRIVEHPRDSEGNLRKFSWDLFEIVGKEVLGVETWEQSYLTTFKRNVLPFAQGVASYVKSKYSIQETELWRNLSSYQRLEAAILLEQGVSSEFPLQACTGHWGARLIMVKAWYRGVIPEAEGNGFITDGLVAY